MISVPNQVLDAIKSGSFEYAWLLEFPDDLNLTTRGADLQFGGKTYLADSGIMSLPTITRSKDIKRHDATPTFADEDGALSTALKGRNLTGETCRIKLVFLDDTGAVISDFAVGMYQGTFDEWRQRQTDSSDTIAVKLTGSFSKPEQTAGRITSNNNQQDRFANDKFFEFAHENRQNLGWGREA